MESDGLKAEITQRKDLLARIESEMDLVEFVSFFVLLLILSPLISRISSNSNRQYLLDVKMAKVQSDIKKKKFIIIYWLPSCIFSKH